MRTLNYQLGVGLKSELNGDEQGQDESIVLYGNK